MKLMTRNLLSARVASPLVGPDMNDFPELLQKRRLHAKLRGGSSPVSNAAKEIEGKSFLDKLTDQFAKTTRINKLSLRAGRDTIVARYLADVAAVSAQVTAVNQFFGVLADTQTKMFGEINPWAHDAARGFQAVEASRRRFASERSLVHRPEVLFGDHVMTAAVATRDVGSILAICRDDVARRCRAAAAYVPERLLAGLQSGLFGLVAWLGTDACWYARNEEHLHLKGHWSGSVFEHWHVLKEVHLMHAATYRGVPGWLDTPPDIDRVVAAIPAVLRPFVNTVVGTMIRERECSWFVGDVRHEPHQRVTPQPAPVFDPAIVIGSVVLTGYERPSHTQPHWWLPLQFGWRVIDSWQARRRVRPEAGGKL